MANTTDSLKLDLLHTNWSHVSGQSQIKNKALKVLKSRLFDLMQQEQGTMDCSEREGVAEWDRGRSQELGRT